MPAINAAASCTSASATVRPAARAARVGRAAMFAALLTCAGCTESHFKPMIQGGPDGELYEAFVVDLLDPVRESQRVWIRGLTAPMGGGEAARPGMEIVVATLQEGDPGSAGPIQKAVVLACRRPPGREPRLLARQVVYDADRGVEDARFPEDIIAPDDSPEPFTHIRAAFTRPNLETGRGLVVVSLWRADENDPRRVHAYHQLLDLHRDSPPPPPSPQGQIAKAEASGAANTVNTAAAEAVTVAVAPAAADRPRHPGARLRADPDGEDGPRRPHFRFRTLLRTLAVQREPVLRAHDVNRDGQIDVIAPMRVLPAWTREIADFVEPEWPVVWMGVGGLRFEPLDPNEAARQNIPPRVHAQLRESWYQAYAEAMSQKLPPERLAHFAYYLGRQHLFEGETSLAGRRLAEAEGMAKDEAARRAILSARELLAAAKAAAAPAKDD